MKQFDINTKYANSLSVTDHFITSYKWEIYHLRLTAQVINFPLVLSDKVIGTTQLSIFGIISFFRSRWSVVIF